MQTKQIRWWLLVLATCASAASAVAEDNLDTWIAQAWKSNPEIAAAREKWNGARERIARARAIDDPMVGADFERSDTTHFDTFTDIEWMVSQKVPWLGKLGARSNAAALEAQAVGFRYLEAGRDVIARVRIAYWNLWLTRRQIEVSRSNQTLLEQVESVARARYEAGSGTQADVLRAQVERARLKNELISLEQEAVVAQASLNRLLNEPLTTPRVADKPIPLPPLTRSLEELQEAARQYCCVLMAAQRQLEAKEAAVKVAKLEYAPDIEFRVEARQLNGKNGIQEYDTGVFLNFPWLWQGKYRAGVREARAGVHAAQAEFDNELSMTLLDIKEDYTKSEAGMRLVEQYEKTILPQAQLLVESTRASYEAGKATFLEWMDALRGQREFQIEADRARAQYGKDFARLEQNIEPWTPREIATGLVSADMK